MTLTRAPLRYTPAHWMQFIDGENLTIQAQALITELSLKVQDCDFFKRDSYLYPQGQGISHAFGDPPPQVEPIPVRSFYYTSCRGDEPLRQAVRTQLWQLGFEAHVFKKTDTRKAKGVDIALTKDMLSHAFRNNYEVAVLVAGDGDYVPLVEEVKRLGKRVEVHFFEAPTNHELKLSADGFTDIRDTIIRWATEEEARQVAAKKAHA